VEFPAGLEKQEASSAVSLVDVSTATERGVAIESDKIDSEAAEAPGNDDADAPDDATDVTPAARSRDSIVSKNDGRGVGDDQAVADDETSVLLDSSKDNSRFWASVAVVGGLVVFGSLLLSRRARR